VVQFEMAKPSNLPFHLLAWGQQYVRVHNCYQFYPKPAPVGVKRRALSATQVAVKKPRSNGTVPLSASTMAIYSRSASNSTQRGGISAALLGLFNPSYDPAINTNLLPKDDGYDICWPSAIAQSHQGPLKPVYLKKFDVSRGRHRHSIGAAAESAATTTTTEVGKANTGTNAGPMIGPVIRYVYFTEADQTVHFDSPTTTRALSAATNDSTFFVGRRKEKNGESDPRDYLGNLDRWKDCGTSGYSMKWPQERLIQID
jgi:hypothetical protein